VDISGGQYGICTPFWPAKDYVNRFLCTTSQPMKMYPHGTHKDVLKILGKIDGNPSMVYGLVGHVAGAIDEAATTFEKSNGLSLSALVHLNDREEFERQKDALLGDIDAAVCNYKAKNDQAIAAKWQASQLYEAKHPGISMALNHKTTHALYAQRLITTDITGGRSIRRCNVGGVEHIVL
jgi:hypothetical protein